MGVRKIVRKTVKFLTIKKANKSIGKKVSKKIQQNASKKIEYNVIKTIDQNKSKKLLTHNLL